MNKKYAMIPILGMYLIAYPGIFPAQAMDHAVPKNSDIAYTDLDTDQPEIPVNVRNGWRTGIDKDSIDYDKHAQIISFTVTEVNQTTGYKIISKMKIYVNENKIFRVESIGYSPDNRPPEHLKGSSSIKLEPIEPDSWAETYQKAVYKYLGIVNAPVNKDAKWKYVTKSTFSYDTIWYYIDMNNIRCDRARGLVYAYGKSHSEHYGDSTSTYIFDIKNATIQAFVREADIYHTETNPSGFHKAYLQAATDYYNQQTHS